MAIPGGGAMLRPSAVVERARAHARSTRKAISKFARPNSFAVPADAEAAAVRAVRNVASFRTYYAAVLWVALLLTLAPHRKATLFFLMAVSKVAGLYFVLLRALPASALLRRILDPRLVLALVVMVIAAQLVVTDAVGHLFFSLGISVPVVLAHAVFRARDDLGGAEEGAGATAGGGGEAVPPAEKKGEKDLESSV